MPAEMQMPPSALKFHVGRASRPDRTGVDARAPMAVCCFSWPFLFEKMRLGRAALQFFIRSW